MFGFDEAAALFQPIDIHLFRDIVLYPKGDDQDQTDDEREAHEIMGVLGNLREGAERFGSDNRQKQELSEGDIQSRQAENDERDCCEPV